MASELRLTTLANNAGTESVDTTYVINGSAKVWFDINQQGTQSIPDSFNCSSLTDLAVGQSQVDFTASMVNDDWAVASQCGNSADDWAKSKYLSANFGTGKCDFLVYGNGSGWVDGWGGAIIMGDLA